ncbi:MAG: 6-phosphogluconolactonase [Bauldia sp.]|nr:6-phosphogluconolactonase [Bauldia sp.]
MTTQPLELLVAADPAGAAARLIVETLRDATAGRRRAAFAVSGGDTPWRALARLNPDDLDWTLVDVFQVDERVAPAGHAARNLTRLTEAFLARLPVLMHPMPVLATDLPRAAGDYADILPPAFDLVQLGLGADGHTASLAPGDAVLEATATVGVTGPYPPGPDARRRMTLTLPALDRAARILWIVTGAGKRAPLAALLSGEADIPANRVRRDRAIVVADAAAAGG